MKNKKKNSVNPIRPAFGFAASLWLFGLALAAAALAADASQTNVTVEVLIFSGRPNPTWQLQDTNCLHTLKAKLKSLPVAFEKSPAQWSRLGFAGFRILGGETIGLPGQIRVYEGVIKTGDGDKASHLKDSAGLEQRLLAESKQQRLEQAVHDAIAEYEHGRKSAP